ncbi:MAG: MMPL family transporter, partial [Thermomicrobiaceae bacterium]|nr:MMPL family transporter [Thermomicrobiaceae bacterium]
MRSLLSTAGLARASARHPWRILGLWAALLLLAGGLVAGLGIDLTTAGNFTSQPESLRGAKLVEQRLRGQAPVTETVVVRSETATVDDPAFRQVVESTTQDLLGLQGVVKQAVNVYQLQAAGAPQAASMVSPDRHATIISVTLQGTYQEAHDHADAYVQTVERHGGNGFQVLTAGDVSIGKEFTDLAETDLRRAEMFGLPAALVVLVVVFGALVAAGVPIVLALASIAVAIGLTAVVGRFTDLSVYVVNMITMIGLAVGIDYALFIISRYREERRHGLEKIDAIAVAGGTASKAVLFSGGTVVLALASLLLIPVNIFRSLGAGAVLVVIVAVLAMLTLVPALLSLLGDRIDWPRRQRSATIAAVGSDRWDEAALHRGFWGRLTRLVMGHPVVSLVLAAGLMAALAVPYA